MAWWERRPGHVVTEYVHVWRDDEGVARVGALAGAVAVLQIMSVLVFARAGTVYALAVPLAAVFGPAGVWGVTFGAVFGELAFGRIELAAMVHVLGVIVAAVVGRALWLQLAYPYRKKPWTAAAAMLPVTAVGTLLGSLVALGLAALVLDTGLVATVPTVLRDHLLLAALVGPPLAIVGAHRDEIPVTGMTITVREWLLTVVLVGVIASAWLVGALLIDVIRTDVRASPHLREEIGRRLPPVIDTALLYVSGPWGWTVQVAIGIVAAGLIALTIATAGKAVLPTGIRRFVVRRNPN